MITYILIMIALALIFVQGLAIIFLISGLRSIDHSLTSHDKHLETHDKEIDTLDEKVDHEIDRLETGIKDEFENTNELLKEKANR